MRRVPDKITDSVRRRFTKFVRKTRKCWIWIGHRDKNGYGRFSISPRLAGVPAHRVAFWIATGKKPTRSVLHACNNPPCVRFHTKHLYSGNQKKNGRDMVVSGRVARGVRHSQAKLRWAEVQKIRRLIAEGKSRVEIVKMIKTKISVTTVTDIRTGKSWRFRR